MQKTIGRRALLIALPFRSLARFTKFDDVTHPELGHQACEACSLETVFEPEMRPQRGNQ